MTALPQEPKSNIPPEAKRVFRGVIFDVFQWQQQLFDGSFTTFERLRRPDTIIVIPIKEDGKIVLTRDSQPALRDKINLPGGRREPNEPLLTAAARELREETGIIAQDFELLWQHQPYSKIDWCIYFFIARDLTFDKPHPDAGEKISTFEVDFDEFMELILDEKFGENDLALWLLRAEKNSSAFAKIRARFHG